MKTSNIFWGILLLTFGVMFLLYNFDLFITGPGELLNYWPALLIVWGLSLLKIPKLIKNILAGLSAIFLGILLVSLLNIKIDVSNGVDFTFNKIGKISKTHHGKFSIDSANLNSFIIDYSNNFKEAELKFDAGTGYFVFKELSDKLLEIESNHSYGDLDFDIIDSSKIDIDFEIENLQDVNIDNDNKARVKLHPNPMWNLDIDVGAPKLEMDLTPFKIRNLLIDGGAADIYIKLGDFSELTNVDMDLSVSNVVIEVPKSSGVWIKSSAGISSTDFDDFDEVAENQFQSFNWNEADNKIKIVIDSGISKIQVKRYD